MIPVKKEHRSFSTKSFREFVLGCDIGGTNTNIGVFGIKNNPNLLFSFHFKTQQLNGLHEAVNYVLDYCEETYGIHIKKACFGVAGPVSTKGDHVKITNLRWPITRTKLASKIRLKKILFINDFSAIGYSVNILPKKDVVTIKKGQRIPKMPIAIIGAGTGLGKAAATYNRQLGFYVPLASEGGHVDFPAQNREEIELVNYIKKSEKIKEVTYEEILSGKGLVNICSYLIKTRRFHETKYTKEIDRLLQPELISKYRKVDKTCKEAFEIFKSVYARFAKSAALDSLSFGGIYIAGGIAAKNKDIFDKRFIRMFMENDKLKHILKKIPIYLILDYNSGMTGAAFAAMKFL